MNLPFRAWVLLACSLLMAPWAYAEPPRPRLYAYPIGEPYSYATGINGSGQIVGWSHEGGPNFAFITGPRGVGMTRLSTLGGGYTYAYGVNASGQVVGRSGEKAFITGPNGSGMRAIAMPVENYKSASAEAINDRGQVVGLYTTLRPDGTEATHSFMTGPNGEGTVRIDGFNPDNTQVVGINNAGNVAGTSTLPDGSSRSFVTGPDGTGPMDLGTGDAAEFQVRALNDKLRIVGEAFETTGRFEGDSSHSFAGELGGVLETKKNFGGGSGYAASVNAHGDFTGGAAGQYRQYRAYIALAGGKPVDLNALVVNLPPKVFLRWGMAINDARQVVVGAIERPGHQSRIYIVCPTENCE